MKAFIEIQPKSHKGGEIFIAEVKDMNEALDWFEKNMEYLKEQASKKRIEYVQVFVKMQYNVIYQKQITA